MNVHFLIILCLQLGIGAFGKRAKIIGGEAADISRHPYVVALRNVMPDYHFCCATIISNRHMLTTAHCMYNKLDALNKIRAYTGSNVPSSSSGKIHKIEHVDMHPAFDGTKTASHDIAILRLKDQLVFGPTLKSIALPEENIREGSIATVLGWGHSEYPSNADSGVLRKNRLKILKQSKCMEFYKDLQMQHFCASCKTEVGICHGDSGGPLVLSGKIIGISSINIPCAKGFPDIFINVFDYLGFINHIIKK